MAIAERGLSSESVHFNRMVNRYGLKLNVKRLVCRPIARGNLPA